RRLSRLRPGRQPAGADHRAGHAGLRALARPRPPGRQRLRPPPVPPAGPLLTGAVRVAEGRSLRRAGGPGPRLVPPLADAGRRTPGHLGRRRDPHALVAVGLRLPPRPRRGTGRTARRRDRPQRPLVPPSLVPFAG